MSTKQELGAFLRAHRERLTPSDVGLAGGGRRRTPGLRREEVAALSGVGVAWYTWLEQGRVDTSRQVLDAVSRALRLDPDAHGHVLSLAGLRPTSADTDSRAVLNPLLGAWPGPAAVVDRHLDVVAANPPTATSGACPSATWCCCSPTPRCTTGCRSGNRWRATRSASSAGTRTTTRTTRGPVRC